MPPLRQISPGDPVSLIGLQGLEEGCSILQDALFYTKGGDQDRLETEVAAGGGATITRALNTPILPLPFTPTYANLLKKIVSRNIAIDFVVEQRNEDPVAALAKRSRKELRTVGYRLQNLFINGDAANPATDFDGWVNLVDPARILAGDLLGVVVPVGGDAVAINQQIAIERLLRVAKYCRNLQGKRIWAYMNQSLYVRWVTVAKKLGYYLAIQEIGETIDTIRGDIVLRSVGMTEAGVELLPFTEQYNDGTSSSIWLVAWGEEEGVTCLTSAGLVGQYLPGINVFGHNQYDLDMVMGVQDINSLVQSPGWKL